MVVTRLWEVTAKGKEWASGSAAPSSNPASNAPVADPEPSVSSYWEYATNSIQGMAANAIGGMVSSFYGSDATNSFHQVESQSPFYHPFFSSSATAAPIITSRLSAIEEYDDHADELPFLTPSHRVIRRRSTSSPWNKTPHSDLVWMFRNNKNPYNSVQGRDTQPSSLTAVRSLVALVPTREDEDIARRLWERRSSHTLVDEDETVVEDSDGATWSRKPNKTSNTTPRSSPPPPPPPYDLTREHSLIDKMNRKKAVSSPSETASQLAEGSIRALRDLALDEAVELQAALRYWNNRWERPLLSWLEAGPMGTFTDSHTWSTRCCW
jgi:hypothetical protein